MGSIKMLGYCSLSCEALGHKSNQFFLSSSKFLGSLAVELTLLCRWEREHLAGGSIPLCQTPAGGK